MMFAIISLDFITQFKQWLILPPVKLEWQVKSISIKSTKTKFIIHSPDLTDQKKNN